MEIQDQLRVEHRKMGQTAPLMQQAADTIDRLQAEIKPLKARVAELEQALTQIRGIGESVLRR